MKKNGTEKLICNTESDVENKFMVTKQGREEGEERRD